jgi:predicted nucleic acid-binding protein
MRDVREAWEAVLTYFDYERIDVGAVAGDVDGLMSRFGLASYDAVHAATTLRPEPVGIVTTDVGFASLPQSTLVYTNAGRVRRCRELRARSR